MNAKEEKASRTKYPCLHPPRSDFSAFHLLKADAFEHLVQNIPPPNIVAIIILNGNSYCCTTGADLLQGKNIDYTVVIKRDENPACTPD